MRQFGWFLVLAVVAPTGAANAQITGQPCPSDEHGPVCALASDEVDLTRAGLEEIAKGAEHGNDGPCDEKVYWPAPSPKDPIVEVKIVSTDGSASIGLKPVAQRLEVNGETSIRRVAVRHGCALLDGRLAKVEVGKVIDGRQVVTIWPRPSIPLTVVVKGGRLDEAVLNAIPPFDWPGTEAKVVPLAFTGDTAHAPDRVPSPAGEFGVWSVAYVRRGKLAAARLVSPTDTRVVLTPGPVAQLRLRVMAEGKPLSISSVWFSDALPDDEFDCGPMEAWGFWGHRDFGDVTIAVVEVPPGPRRSVFVRTGTDVTSMKAPKSAGTFTRDLTLSDP